MGAPEKDPQAVRRLLCHPELRRRGSGSGTLKGRKTIYRKMGRTNVWHTTDSQKKTFLGRAVKIKWDTERNLISRPC